MLICPLNSKVSPVGLRTSFTVTALAAEGLRGAGHGLTVDSEIGDEAVLAVGAFLGGIADVEHRRGDGLALPVFLEDDVGVAVHQAVDGRKIPCFVGVGGLRRELDLSDGKLRRCRHQAKQTEQKRAHIKFLAGQNWPLP